MKQATVLLLIAPAIALTRPAPAQSLERRVLERDGSVQFTFASRPGVCGDGTTYVRDGFGGNSRIYQGDNFGRTRGDDWPPCVPGPLRVVAAVSSGELLRLRTYAGPLRRETTIRDLGVVSAGEAADFLKRIIERARGRAATDAVLPFVLSDSITPWPTLLHLARSDQLSKSIRSTISFWLARGAAAKLGLANRDDDEDDDIRSSAVFALSQQPRETAIPRLLEIARNAPHPAARAQALFWLGQSGDARAIDLFEEILMKP